MAENPERAALLGIGVGALSSLVWTVAGVLVRCRPASPAS